MTSRLDAKSTTWKSLRKRRDKPSIHRGHRGSPRGPLLQATLQATLQASAALADATGSFDLVRMQGCLGYRTMHTRDGCNDNQHQHLLSCQRKPR